MKSYTIPYSYTVVAFATVEAESLEAATEIVENAGPCPEPDDRTGDGPISSVRFSYLEGNFEVHYDDLEIHN